MKSRIFKKALNEAINKRIIVSMMLTYCNTLIVLLLITSVQSWAKADKVRPLEDQPLKQEPRSLDPILKVVPQGQLLVAFDGPTVTKMHKDGVFSSNLTHFPSDSVLSKIKTRKGGVDPLNAVTYMQAEKICKALGQKRVLALNFRSLSGYGDVGAKNLLELSKKNSIVKADLSRIQPLSDDHVDQAIVFTKLWCDNVDPGEKSVSASDIEEIQSVMDVRHQNLVNSSDEIPARNDRRVKGGNFDQVLPIGPDDQIGKEQGVQGSGLAQ